MRACLRALFGGALGIFFFGGLSWGASPPDVPLDVDSVDAFGHPAICAATDAGVASLGDQRESAQCVFLWRVAHGSAPVMAPGDGNISGLYGEGLRVDIEALGSSSVSIAGLPVLTNIENTPQASVLFGAFCAFMFWGAISAGKS